MDEPVARADERDLGEGRVRELVAEPNVGALRRARLTEDVEEIDPALAADPQVAVAVMLERCQGCFGGEVAGPIATQIMESLLGSG